MSDKRVRVRGRAGGEDVRGMDEMEVKWKPRRSPFSMMAKTVFGCISSRSFCYIWLSVLFLFLLQVSGTINPVREYTPAATAHWLLTQLVFIPGCIHEFSTQY